MDDPEKYSLKKLAIIAGLLLLVVIAIWSWSEIRGFIGGNLTLNSPTKPTALYNAMASGDYAQAGAEAQSLLSSNTALSPVDASWAHLAIVDSDVESATSSSSEYAAA